MSNRDGSLPHAEASMSGLSANMANMANLHVELQKKLITSLEDAYALENEIVRALDGPVKDGGKTSLTRHPQGRRLAAGESPCVSRETRAGFPFSEPGRNGRRSHALSVKGAQAGDRLAEDQCVDLVGSLVGED
jgi:hypothetical protein